MTDIKKLANSLRQLSKDDHAAPGRTQTEKLATIALIHNEMKKESNLRNKLLLGGGLLAGTAGAGYYGHESGKSTGRKKGRKEMYEEALPYVRGAIVRSRRAEEIARRLARKSRLSKEKQASLASRAKALGLTAGAAALPATAYYAGSNVGSKKGRKAGRVEVTRSALKRIANENARFRRAVNYIMSQKKKNSGG